MPQPLSKVFPKANIVSGAMGDRLFIDAQSKLASYAIQVIASWSQVEKCSQRLYIDLAGGPHTDAAIMYMALEGSAPKQAVAKTLAELKLTPDRLDMLNALLKLSKSGEKERNKIAHWIWGYIPETPGVLLLIDPKDINPTFDQIMVYREADFKSILGQIDKIGKLWFDFNFYVNGNLSPLGYASLCSELGF